MERQIQTNGIRANDEGVIPVIGLLEYVSPPDFADISEDTLVTKGMLQSAVDGGDETVITVNSGTALTSDSGAYYYQVDMSAYPQYGLNPTRWVEWEVTSLIREKRFYADRKVLDGGGNLLYLRFYLDHSGGNTIDKNFIIIKK